MTATSTQNDVKHRRCKAGSESFYAALEAS